MPRRNEQPTLSRGDILLTKGSFDTLTHAVINIGQAVFSHSKHGNYDFCHAAIYLGEGGNEGLSHMVAEAVGGGVSVNPIESGHTYVVFRYRDAGLAEAVAQTAYNWAMPSLENGQRMKYNFGRLGTSVFSLSGLGFFGKKRVQNLSTQIGKRGAPKNYFGATKSMICSEFAISCWNATSYAKAQVYAIDADPTSCTPKELSNKLRKSPDWFEYDPLAFNQPQARELT
jgi:hypothetical protein